MISSEFSYGSQSQADRGPLRCGISWAGHEHVLARQNIGRASFEYPRATDQDGIGCVFQCRARSHLFGVRHDLSGAHWHPDESRHRGRQGKPARNEKSQHSLQKLPTAFHKAECHLTGKLGVLQKYQDTRPSPQAAPVSTSENGTIYPSGADPKYGSYWLNFGPCA